MNYRELVISKTPRVYVSYDAGSNAPDIGATAFTSTAGSNPQYVYTFKKMGARAKRSTATVGAYDYRLYYDPSGGTGVGSKCFYWHQEFFIYLTGVPTSTFNLGGFSYSNVSPSGTFTGTAGIQMTSGRIINFGTNNNAMTEGHTLNSVTVIPTNTWVHIALQYDYGVKRIYINGVLDVEVSTGLLDGVGRVWTEPLSSSRIQTYIDEAAWWSGNTTTKPADFPTAADILQRATFPMTKTKWWDTATSSFITSTDELYWNGSAWESMQDKTYQYWNGTSWVTL